MRDGNRFVKAIASKHAPPREGFARTGIFY
jgi:hypothetical protein